MSRAQEVVTAYENWDPATESSTELAHRLGISKARLYQILKEEGLPPKARRLRIYPGGPTISSALAGWSGAGEITDTAKEDSDSDLVGLMVERGVRSLLEELELLRAEVAKYRNRYGPLD